MYEEVNASVEKLVRAAKAAKARKADKTTEQAKYHELLLITLDEAIRRASEVIDYYEERQAASHLRALKSASVTLRELRASMPVIDKASTWTTLVQRHGFPYTLLTAGTMLSDGDPNRESLSGALIMIIRMLCENMDLLPKQETDEKEHFKNLKGERPH